MELVFVREFLFKVFGTLVENGGAKRIFSDGCVDLGAYIVELFLSHVALDDVYHIIEVELAFVDLVECAILLDGGDAEPVGNFVEDHGRVEGGGAGG